MRYAVVSFVLIGSLSISGCAHGTRFSLTCPEVCAQRGMRCEGMSIGNSSAIAFTPAGVGTAFGSRSGIQCRMPASDEVATDISDAAQSGHDKIVHNEIEHENRREAKLWVWGIIAGVGTVALTVFLIIVGGQSHSSPLPPTVH